MSDDISSDDIALRNKLIALYRVGSYRPKFAFGIISLSVFTAILEGIGLGFIVPVIEISQGARGSGGVSKMGRAFISLYDFLGIPFQLETVVGGVGLVMVIRYSSSFLVTWLQSALRTDYIRHLQTVAFRNALNARISYYDEHGSDEILNAIVTQAEYASKPITNSVRVIEQGFLSLVYLSIALYIAPWLTIFTGVILGGALHGLRRVLESGYSVGDRVADGNERVQKSVQAGTQGIREVKLFGLSAELMTEFSRAVDQFADSFIKLRRNQSMMDNFYQMITAVMIFGLIYMALRIASLSLASLGVFLFALFRLAPRVSSMNNYIYNIEGSLPHLIRMQNFLSEIQENAEIDNGEDSPPVTVEKVTFEDVVFGYDDDEVVLDGVSFTVEQGEFIAFVGPSGAGKSTIVSLLSRMYEPDSGRILGSGTPINDFQLKEWREHVSVVQQDPHIFNQTLRYNITLGNRNASEEAIREACEIAEVTEFLSDLPNGLDTVLGDDGVRLSGGQRQRVALARALLKDADILVLDEATSNLDSNIEESVHNAIEGMDRDYIMIVIAHRLSTVVTADCIYTMEDGQVEEQGVHEELVNKDGTYSELYTTQSHRR